MAVPARSSLAKHLATYDAESVSRQAACEVAHLVDRHLAENVEPVTTVCLRFDPEPWRNDSWSVLCNPLCA